MNDLTKQEWDALYDRMANGTATYEDAATMWLNTMAGQMSGVPVEEFTARLRAKYPTPEALAAIFKQLVAAVPEQFRPRPAPRAVEPDECAANMNGHRFGPHGRHGETQCEWCGQPAGNA